MRAYTETYTVFYLGLCIFWSQASNRGFSLHDVVRVMCEEPAKLSRLSHRKGKIAVGMDADFVLWDPDEPIVVREEIRLRFEGSCTSQIYREIPQTKLSPVNIFERLSMTFVFFRERQKLQICRLPFGVCTRKLVGLYLSLLFQSIKPINSYWASILTLGMNHTSLRQKKMICKFARHDVTA